MTTPLVSISCNTYNHAPYIRQCLDGFMMQKTSFPFEVLVHDDASTDGTSDIIREFEQKYPDIIKPIYQTENQHSKKIAISRKYNYPRLLGKYLALCEGDDYWTDEDKLQKQVDFLEANGDFSICFHPVRVFREEDGVFAEDYPAPDIPDIMDIRKLTEYNHIGTCSVMYRIDKKVFDDLNTFPVLPVGDYLLNMLYARNGKIKKLPDTMAVYRIHKGGTWSSKTLDYQHTVWLKVLESLIIHFGKEQEVSELLKERYIKTANELLVSYAVNNGGIIPQDVFDQIIGFSKEVFNTIISKYIIENCMLKDTIYYSIIKNYGDKPLLTFILRCYRRVNYIITKISHYFKKLSASKNQ